MQDRNDTHSTVFERLPKVLLGQAQALSQPLLPGELLTGRC